MTVDKLIAEMDKALQFPGVSNADVRRINGTWRRGSWFPSLYPRRREPRGLEPERGSREDIREPVTTTVEGRERYTVSIRYPRDYRSDPQAIATEVLIPIAGGGTVPLGHLESLGLVDQLTRRRRTPFGKIGADICVQTESLNRTYERPALRKSFAAFPADSKVA